VTAYFADTYFYLALLAPNDADHERVCAFNDDFEGSIVTTDWVLIEVADAMSMGRNRERFVQLLDFLRSNKDVRIVRCSPDLFDRGIELYRERPDKNWSLTDCLSFTVMKDNGLRVALTGDQHFEQAGFQALWKE
jgi:hypothetical protein